jgi:hypothetical protein
MSPIEALDTFLSYRKPSQITSEVWLAIPLPGANMESFLRFCSMTEARQKEVMPKLQYAAGTLRYAPDSKYNVPIRLRDRASAPRYQKPVDTKEVS